MAITINGNGTITGISVGGLPDGIVDADMLASGASGLREADMWRLSANLSLTSGVATVLTSNWERPDTANDGFNYLGTGMSVDGSGVWTFPSTGYWQVNFSALWNAGGSTSDANWLYIQATEDNSTWESAVLQAESTDNGNTNSGHISTIIDCTNTSNVKVRLRAYAGAANQLVYGSSTQSRTYVQFLKLGDT